MGSSSRGLRSCIGAAEFSTLHCTMSTNGRLHDQSRIDEPISISDYERAERMKSLEQLMDDEVYARGVELLRAGGTYACPCGWALYTLFCSFLVWGVSTLWSRGWCEQLRNPRQ